MDFGEYFIANKEQKENKGKEIKCNILTQELCVWRMNYDMI